MPNQVYWLEKPWIMLAAYEGRVTVQDYEHVMSTCLAELDKQPVYFLVDLSKVNTQPLALTKIPSLLRLCRHANTMAFGWVGANKLNRTLIPMVVHKPYKFFDTREVALAYLQERVALEHPKEEASEQATGNETVSV